MNLRLITSRENPMIKEYLRLNIRKGCRAETGTFAFEGARLCGDALGSNVPVKTAFFTSQAADKHEELIRELLQRGAEVFEISDAVAEKIKDTKTPQGIFCTARLLDNTLRIDKIDIGGAYAALENLQDPGNLGTVLRCAEAMGLEGVLLSADCADIYSPKVVRASMGAVFRLPFYIAEDLPGLISELSQKGFRTFAAVADRKAKSLLSADLGSGSVVAVGNEGAGLTPECAAACGERITIPMPGRAESLNAGAAAAILIWETARHRLKGIQKETP